MDSQWFEWIMPLCSSASRDGERFQRRVAAYFDESAAQQKTVCTIEIEQLNGSRAVVRQRHDAGTVQTKVIAPAVQARMIETHETRRAANEGSGVGAFGHITPQAGQREIGSFGGAALLPADDVIHLKRERGISLVNQTVFTNALCALEHEAPQTC
jgi:hypothetical protein